MKPWHEHVRRISMLKHLVCSKSLAKPSDRFLPRRWGTCVDFLGITTHCRTHVDCNVLWDCMSKGEQRSKQTNEIQRNPTKSNKDGWQVHPSCPQPVSPSITTTGESCTWNPRCNMLQHGTPQRPLFPRSRLLPELWIFVHRRAEPHLKAWHVERLKHFKEDNLCFTSMGRAAPF